MSDIDDLLTDELKHLPPKPGNDASQKEKKAYSEQMSAAIARAFGAALRRRGLDGITPAPPAEARNPKVKNRAATKPKLGQDAN